jgi:DNA-directed RNA polymerase specialized sigma54-like protein
VLASPLPFDMSDAPHKRHFDYDPVTGLNEVFIWNDDGTFTIQVQQDVEPAIEANKKIFNEYSGPRDKWGEMHRVASIPLSIYQEWLQSGKTKDKTFIKRWLNDPDNAAFRTRPGKV